MNLSSTIKSIQDICIDKNAPEPLKRLVFESFEI